MVTVKTQYPKTDTILNPGSRRYIPSEEVEELNTSFEKPQDMGGEFKEVEIDTREEGYKKVNKAIDKTRVMSFKEKRDRQTWK